MCHPPGPTQTHKFTEYCESGEGIKVGEGRKSGEATGSGRADVSEQVAFKQSSEQPRSRPGGCLR